MELLEYVMVDIIPLLLRSLNKTNTQCIMTWCMYPYLSMITAHTYKHVICVCNGYEIDFLLSKHLITTLAKSLSFPSTHRSDLRCC